MPIEFEFEKLEIKINRKENKPSPPLETNSLLQYKKWIYIVTITKFVVWSVRCGRSGYEKPSRTRNCLINGSPRPRNPQTMNAVQRCKSLPQFSIYWTEVESSRSGQVSADGYIFHSLLCLYVFSAQYRNIYIIYIRIKSTLFKYCSNVKKKFKNIFQTWNVFIFFFIPFMLKALSQLIKVKKGAKFILLEECNL